MSDLQQRRPLPVQFAPNGRPIPATLARCGNGVAWWEDYPGALRTRVDRAVSRGEVVVLREQRRLAVPKRNYIPIEGVLVRQLKPMTPRWRKPALAGVIVVAFLTIPAVLLYRLLSAAWDARGVIATALVVAVVACLAVKGLAHKATCSGIHCGGCRG